MTLLSSVLRRFASWQSHKDHRQGQHSEAHAGVEPPPQATYQSFGAARLTAQCSSDARDHRGNHPQSPSATQLHGGVQSSAEEFYGWVDFFDEDERARPALPLLLAQEIEGIGFALACDFLKELGYENFSKPDVHVKDIFWAIRLSSLGTSDYEVFKDVARVGRNASVTPYDVDKLFWLVGSGYFYDDPHLGKKGKIGSQKKRFIEEAKIELEGRQTL
jgi:hypothetical protein